LEFEGSQALDESRRVALREMLEEVLALRDRLEQLERMSPQLSADEDMYLRLKEFREARFLTQKELSAKAKVGEATIARLEKGVQQPAFRRLAAALAVESSDLEIRDEQKATQVLAAPGSAKPLLTGTVGVQQRHQRRGGPVPRAAGQL
jgi:transcriptional regulator with XRE-family HTH domain